MCKTIVKKVLEALCGLIACPLYVFYRLNLFDYATIGQLLAVIPSVFGVYLRRSWYHMSLAYCGRELVVDWMGVIKTPKAQVGNNFYFGVNSFMAEAIVGDDVMISGHCLILSGGNHHGMKLGIPMRLQTGNPHSIRIGGDTWIGVNSVIMADVMKGTVVGSGSVVTKTYQPYDVLVGSPARPIKNRQTNIKEKDVHYGTIIR